MKKTDAILYYCHDPMCSWCWGFKSTWNELQSLLKDKLEINYVLGGLAADTDEPMPDEMRQYLQQTWHKIQQYIPGTDFNFNFWQTCQPRRATYASCRAVLAVKHLQPDLEMNMIEAIQRAYYLQAKNPSDDETLIRLAVELGINKKQFIEAYFADAIQQQLLDEIRFCEELGAEGFPSLVLVYNQNRRLLTLDYLHANTMYEEIEIVLEQQK